MKLIKGLYILLSLSIISCNTNKNKSENSVVDFDSIELGAPKKVLNSLDTVGEGLPIFYNMYLSVEMSSLFESVGAVFNQDLLNKSDKTGDYITSSKKALNMGVYAVDLSYCRIFEQFELAGRYFTSMQKLAEELGIPSDYFINTSKRFDRNINDKDSLITIANEVYVSTDKYLKENEQYSASAQIILGGWIEAMNIALDVAQNTKDIEIIERIAEQKHSLENLIEMLSAYKSDEVINNYIKKLVALQSHFNSFEVKVENNFDPSSDSGKKLISGYIEKINVIRINLSELRNELVE